MTLADLFVPHLPEGPQNAVAMEWLQRWLAADNKPLSAATVESRFSDLLKERIDGVRFFYNDPAREALLGDVLGLDEREREAARARAREILDQKGAQATRLVVDVSDLTRGDEAALRMFKAVKQDLLGDEALLPAVLVVTEDQYDRLPRSFDDYGERLRKVRVANATAGRTATLEHAGDSAVVAAPWRFEPATRWLAMAWHDDRLEFGPADGPQQVRAHGRLPAPPTPTFDAADLLDAPPRVKPRLPDDAIRLRALLDGLGDEEGTKGFGDVTTRVALATELGIRAASTEKERAEAAFRRKRAVIEAEIRAIAAALPLAVGEGTRADLDRALTRASRVRAEPVALRVGDEVHLVCAEDADAPSLPRLTVHRVAVKPTALQRLQHALAGMTADDLRDDPLLLGVVDRLAGGSAEERKLLLHARAGLVLSGAIVPAPGRRVDDWRGALARLLGGEPPAARLDVQVVAQPVPWINGLKLTPWVYPDGQIYLPEVKDVEPLYRVPPVACPFLDRSQKLVAFHPIAGRSVDSEDWDSAPSALVSFAPAEARDAEQWLALVEASPMFGASGQTATRAWKPTMLPPAVPDWVESPIGIGGETWQRADRELAMAWLALRRALQAGEAVRLHDGTVLLELGGGIVAEVEVRVHGRDNADVVAAIGLDVEDVRLREDHNRLTHTTKRFVTANLGSLVTRVDTHLAMTGSTYVTRLGYALPRRITLVGRGVIAEVRFEASPLLAATGAAPNTAAIGGAIAAVPAATD